MAGKQAVLGIIGVILLIAGVATAIASLVFYFQYSAMATLYQGLAMLGQPGAYETFIRDVAIRDSWLMYLILGAIVLIVGIVLLIVFLVRRSRGRTGK